MTRVNYQTSNRLIDQAWRDQADRAPGAVGWPRPPASQGFPADGPAVPGPDPTKWDVVFQHLVSSFLQAHHMGAGRIKMAASGGSNEKADWRRDSNGATCRQLKPWPVPQGKIGQKDALKKILIN